MNQSVKQHFIFWLIPLFFIFLWYFRLIIMPFLIGIILGSSIQALAYYFHHRLKINYHLVVFLIYLLILLGLFIFLSLMVKILLQETPSLLEKLNPYIKVLRQFGFKEKWQDFLSLSEYFPNVFRFMMSFFGGLTSLILIFIVSIYVSFSKNFPESVFPFFKFKEEHLKIWRKIRRKLAFWFLGEGILMVFIGVATYIFVGLILQIKYAALISLSAGLLEIVPILGPVISLVFASLIAFIYEPAYVPSLVIYFIALQQIENHLLVPLVMKKAINLNPLLAILGVLIGAKIGGILGIIVILPIFGGLIEILNIAGSSNGRTLPSGGRDPGSNPGPAI